MAHKTKRCDTCEFWDRNDQQINEYVNNGRHPDDHYGNCHRNAPPASLGEWEYEVMNLLSTIAWEVGDTGEKNLREHGDWEEAYLSTSSWPGTHARHWCGEWRQREPENKEKD